MAFEDLAHGRAYRRHVFHDEHRLAALRGSPDRRRDLRLGELVDPWEVDLERRALTGFAIYPDEPAGLLDDAVYCRQAKSGTLAGLFGGEVRLEQAGLIGSSMPIPVSLTASIT